MLSRVADSLYWLGRYSERVYTNAYITSVQIDQMLEMGRTEKQFEHQWYSILSICGYIDDFEFRYEGYDTEQMLYYLIADKQNYNSIFCLLESIRNNVKNTRDCIPNALFEEWNSLYLETQELQLLQPFNELQSMDYLINVKKKALTTTGIIDSLMTRDECFQFIKIGKWLERSEKTALIILKLMESENGLQQDFTINMTLQITNAFEAYNRRTRLRDADKVLNFLIGDVNCSRSVAYGIKKIKRTIFDIEQYEIRPYTKELFEVIDQLEHCLLLNASDMTISERKQWVKDIHQQCIMLGPIFSNTYYLTKPILVK